MKKVLFAVFGIVLGLSQVAVAAEKSPLYVGIGLARISNGGIPVSLQEQMFMGSGPNGPYQYSRSEKSRGLGGDIFIGYKLTKVFALEAGYLGGSNGLKSSTTGTINFTEFWGNNTSEPFSVTQTKKVSAWYISAIGEEPLTGRISLIGRFGVMQSKTDWEQRLAYGCSPGFSCGGDGSYKGWSSSATRTAALFGVGLAMKVTDNIDVRVEVMDSSALPSAVPMADMVFRF